MSPQPKLDKVRVFISHKHEDREIAHSVKTLLEVFAPNRLDFFVSGENITPGEDYKKRIRDELRESNLLFLLFTEPTKEWDWCLYEAGLFSPLLSDAAERKIVCFYAADGDGPRPLTNLQGVKASPASIAAFLKKFFRTSEITGADPPLNDKLKDKHINAVAKKLCQLFGTQNIDSYYPCHRIAIVIPSDVKLKTNIIPREAEVSGNASSLAIFGLGEGKHQWSDIVDGVGKHGRSDWVEELGKAFDLAARRRVVEPVTGTFREANGGKIYRPFLYKLELDNERPSAVYVALTEEHTPHEVGGPMFKLLKMSTRFHEEVISPHLGNLDELAKRKGKHVAARQVLESIRAIELESANRGSNDVKRIQADFGPDPARKKRIKEFFDQWSHIREDIDVATRNEDIKRLEEILLKLDHLQRQFMLLAAERYNELIREDNQEFLLEKNTTNKVIQMQN